MKKPVLVEGNQLLKSQDFSVKGKVFSDGQPVESASVFIKGSNLGVTTDVNGDFLIYFSDIKNPKLVISYLGYKSRLLTVSSFNMNFGIIELETDELLDEVVVSGTLKPVSKLNSPVPVDVYNQSFFKANPTPSVFEALENINGIWEKWWNYNRCR